MASRKRTALASETPKDSVAVLSVAKTVAAAGAVRTAMVPLKPLVGPVFGNLVLLTSEVVANTVTWSTRSSRDHITVRIAYGRGPVLVEVADCNDGFDAPSKPASLHELGGWRESLVARLADVW